MGNLDEPIVKNAVGEHFVVFTPSASVRGVYGDYYQKRVLVTQVGLGANLPEDACPTGGTSCVVLAGGGY
jgi:hypothetical protein